MIVSEELKNLARLFPVPLYVVGGAVRDHVLGFRLSDYDLSSSLLGEEVIALLEGTEFKATPHSLKLGTLGIKVGDKVMEYTSFRKDSYSLKGDHTPKEVKFGVEIAEDARRRDFTVNALYYDIRNERIIDFLGGENDARNKILKTTREPSDVFEEDALRILRMVRFCAKLGFKVEEKTYLEAKKRVSSLNEIAVERIREEFHKILIADTENGVEGAHIIGIKILIDLGAMEYIIPELAECAGVRQPKKYHKYDVLQHILETVKIAPPALRLAALLHDVGKPRSRDGEGHMDNHPLIGAQMAREIMERLRYPKAETERVCRLVEKHMFDLKGNSSDEEVRIFILKNIDILEELVALKKADFVAHGVGDGESPSAKRLERVKDEMIKEGVAFKLKDLPIGGEHLVKNGVPAKERGRLLNRLLEEGARLGRALNEEECLSYIIEH